MVLKLIDICMNSISKNLDQIKHLDVCLTPTQKELIIQRLANHGQFHAHNLQSIIKALFTSNIKTIKFYKCEQINEKFLRAIARNPNSKFQLKSLTIARCDNVTDDSLKEFMENQHCLEDVCFKRLITQFTQTFACFKSSKLALVDLSYSSTLTDKDLLNLCKNNPNIKSLILTHCALLTNDGLKNAFSYLNDLECLDIEGIKGIDESSIIKFKNLKKLNFYGSDHLNSISLIKLFENCTRLKELNILYSWTPSTADTAPPNNQLANNSIIPQFANSMLYIPDTLETLILFRPNIREPQVLIDSLKRLKCLRKLSLHCVECINDQTLTQILEVIGPNLVSLDLGGYMAIPNRLTETSIKSIAKYCKNLEHLCLDLFSATATLDSLSTLFTTDYELNTRATTSDEYSCRRAYKLKTVRLSACRRVSYDLLLQVASYCVNLTHLDVSGLSELIDDNFMELLALNSTKLQVLDLKACTKLTDKSVCLIAVKCPIQCFVLSGIHSLTDKIIFVIANHLQFTLKEIYLSGCSKITSVALRYLADCCINYLFCEHRVPNLDPNQLMAKNLDTGHFERVDQINFNRKRGGENQ